MISSRRKLRVASSVPHGLEDEITSSLKDTNQKQRKAQDERRINTTGSMFSIFKIRRRSNSKNSTKKMKITMSKAAKTLLCPKISSSTHADPSQDFTETMTSVESLATTTTTTTSSDYFNLLLRGSQKQKSSCHHQYPSGSLTQENIELINEERLNACIPALHRSHELDALAAVRVEIMMNMLNNQKTQLEEDDNQLQLLHSTQTYLREKLASPYWGENIAIGDTIQDIHTVMTMMPKPGTSSDNNSDSLVEELTSMGVLLKEEARNIMDPHFRQIGIATTKTNNNGQQQIILCQLFRG